MKTKIQLAVIFCLLCLHSFAGSSDFIKVISADLTVIASIKSGAVADSTKIEFSIQNNSDSDYLYFPSSFSANLNFADTEQYCFLSNIIAENCGKVTLDAIKPNEIVSFNMPISTMYGYSKGIGEKFIEKKNFVIEVNYIMISPDENQKKENQLSFGRIYFLDQSKRLLISNFR